jgi:hypothetical protein
MIKYDILIVCHLNTNASYRDLQPSPALPWVFLLDQQFLVSMPISDTYLEYHAPCICQALLLLILAQRQRIPSEILFMFCN